MLVVSGIYRWFPTASSFRNDYCLACDQPQRAFLIETFDCIHIFWIPLVPLGRRSRWSCSVCGSEPRQPVKTRRGFKVAGVFVLIFFSLISWGFQPRQNEEILLWIIRVGLMLALVGLLAHLLTTSKKPSLKERLESVLPAADRICPVCDIPADFEKGWACPRCGITRQ